MDRATGKLLLLAVRQVLYDRGEASATVLAMSVPAVAYLVPEPDAETAGMQLADALLLATRPAPENAAGWVWREQVRSVVAALLPRMRPDLRACVEGTMAQVDALEAEWRR